MTMNHSSLFRPRRTNQSVFVWGVATSVLCLALIGGAISPIHAADTAPATQPLSPPDSKPAPDPKPAPFTVAILDFEAKDPGQPDLGKHISDALTAILSGESEFTLVERATLTRTLQEHELNLTGVVDTTQAVKVGRLSGARIMVVGRTFMLGQKMFITAKIIGVETSLVEGVLVKGEADAKIDELVMQLADALTKRLKESGPKLIAQGDAVDPLPALKTRLATLKLPTVAVIVFDQHHGEAVQRAIDPAVETEIKMLLKDCGIQIKDVPQNDLANWAGKNSDDVESWPQSLSGVDYVITGKGFSEYSARIGNLVSCAARAEINVISRKNGKILLADRVTTRDVDLAENIAGKKALQKAGHELGIDILAEFAKTLPAAEKK